MGLGHRTPSASRSAVDIEFRSASHRFEIRVWGIGRLPLAAHLVLVGDLISVTPIHGT